MRARVRGRRALAMTAIVVAVVAIGPAAFAEVGTIGPQAMEGNLRVNPGDIIRAGLSFTMPGTHPEAIVQFDTSMTFWGVQCVTGSGGGDIVVPMGNDGLVGPFIAPRNDPSWFPTGDQSSAASYQGAIAAPDLCNGGTMSLRNGATFTADMQSDSYHTANVRFHYSANGSSGSWSATETFTPSPLPGSEVPSGASGVFVGAMLLGSVFLVKARRRSAELVRS